MSAICGIINFDEKPVEKADLVSMVESSHYRGPDGAAFHLDGDAGFAHLAFHVTGESTHERQPLVSVDGRLVLVGDVRLDNREELIAQFTCASDSKLILEAFQRWGEDCLEHLIGDFVFAIWNSATRELFLARDQLGGHSVTYHWTGRTLLFASETAAILDLPEVKPVINEDAVVKTLAAMGMNAEETFFKAVHHVPPAHYLHATKTGLTLRRYWDIDPDKRIRYRHEDEYTDHFLELMRVSVGDRLRSGTPAGLALSGGHDSTLLAAVAAEHLAGTGQELHSFSYVFDLLDKCDERQYIEPVVQRYGIEAHYIFADKMWTFARMPEQQIPRDFLWTNCYAWLPESVANEAQRVGCRVLMSGAFGDALFSEPSLAISDLWSRGRLDLIFRLLRQYPKHINVYRDVIQNGLRPLLPENLRRAYRRLKPVDWCEFAPGLPDSWTQRLPQLLTKIDPGTKAGLFSPGRRSRYSRLLDTSWAQGFAATRVQPYNRSGMERLNPYFDRRLVEFVMAIPTEELSHPGRPRKLQNNAMRRLLPEKVHQRRGKTTFNELLTLGLWEKEKKVVTQLVTQPSKDRHNWVRQDWMEQQLEKGPEMDGREELFFTQALHLELWLRSIQKPLQGRAKWFSPGHWK